jgi:tripartite-type tricarboxylate transporter receptor subunit TctC
LSVPPSRCRWRTINAYHEWKAAAVECVKTRPVAIAGSVRSSRPGQFIETNLQQPSDLTRFTAIHSPSTKEDFMRIITNLFAVLALAAISAASSAQGFPNKPIRLIVAFSAGGPTDVLARAIGQKLSETLGQQVAIDNRPGAGGNIGSEIVAKAPPDGYTLVMGIVGTHAINPSLYSKMPYDPVKDFAPVILTASATITMVAHPSVPARSVKELIALAKSKPRQLNFASPGNGTPQHLAGELFKTMAGVDIVHIPYRGAAPAIIDLLGGQVSLAFVSLPAALPHVKARKLAALGISASKRSAVAPDVPTIAESGLRGYEAENWYGVLAPAGTRREIVNKLNSEIVKVLQMPDVKERLYNQGFDILSSTPEEFAAYIKSEIIKWAKVVKDSGAKID